MAAKAKVETLPPWVEHYPPGVRWDVKVSTIPIHQQVLEVCANTPKALAFDFLGAQTNFETLGKAINAFAGALQARLGVTKGVRVALMLPNSPFYAAAYYGVLAAGGTVVNCNPLYTLPELSHIVKDAGADIIVTLDLKALFDKAEALCAKGAVKTVIVCNFAEALGFFKGVGFRLTRGKDIARPAASAIASNLVYYHDFIAANLVPEPVEIDPFKDVAVQQYTGGTTGVPKGAMLSHANIVANLSQIDEWAGTLFHAPSKVMAVLPFFHIFSMTACLNLPLSNGATVVMLPRFELQTLLDTVARTKANILLVVPTLVQALAHAKNAKERLASVQITVSGGASLADELHEAYGKVSAARLAEGYGLTEASPVVCCAALNVASKSMSIGQPLPATEVRVSDLENPGRTVPVGEKGEIQVKGPQVMLGYYGNESANQEAFVDGWLRTGDVGYMDEEGYFFLVDRIKDLIICSGFNVYPRVIEEALYRHEAVEQTNVIGVPDEYRGEAPVAFVKLKPGADISENALKTFLGEHINKVEMPREIIFRDELPKTLVGKLSKNELREQYRVLKEGAK